MITSSIITLIFTRPK